MFVSVKENLSMLSSKKTIYYFFKKNNIFLTLIKIGDYILDSLATKFYNDVIKRGR